MSYRARLSTVVIASVFLFGAAVFIWGYQTGKVIIFGSQQTSEVTSTFDSQTELSQGQANDQIDLSSTDGLIKLKSLNAVAGGLPTNKVGVYTSPTVGSTDVVSFGTFSSIGETIPQGALSQSFSDVPTNNWAFKQIEALYRAGVTNGCSTATNTLKYCPTNNVTRDHLAAMMVRAFYFPDSMPSAQHPGSYYFSDVQAGSTFDKEIGLANELTIMTGYGDKTFHPLANASRDQMAVAITRALRLDTSSFDPNNESTWAANFPDVAKDAFGWKEIQACAKAGIIQGYPDGTYRPSSPLDRAQTAVFIAKAYPQIGDLTTKFIAYQFAGSGDGSTWSAWKSPGAPTTTSFKIIQKAYAQNSIDPSGLIPSGSKFIRVRVILSALNATSGPSLSGFSFSYAVAGATSDADSTSTATALVSTGESLWFNLLVALVIASIVAFILLRKKQA